MKPAKFNHYAPESLEDAFRLLAEHGDEAKIIAGGQSLIPVMNLRLSQPEHLIDINGIEELAGISKNGDRITIGALTRHSEVLESPLVRESCPPLTAAAGRIGHLAIRNRGTIGGSLSNADPAAEWSLMAFLLDAGITVASAHGSRTVRASNFILSIYTTDLEADEILTSISFPALAADEGWSLQQISRRAGDFAIVAVAATMRLDDGGAVSNLRLCLGGMESTPLRMTDVEQAAAGKMPDEDWIATVSTAAAMAGSPTSDTHASAEYRHDVCSILTERALTEALNRARGGR